MPRRITFTKDQTKALLREVEDRFRQTQTEWKPWIDDLPYCLKQYRGILDPKSEPWPDCSNMAVPLTPMAVERQHSSSVALLDQRQDLVSIVPNEFGDVEQAEAVQAFINTMHFGEMQSIPKLDKMAHSTAMFGMQHAIVVWRREQHRTRDCYYVPKSELGKGKRAPSAEQCAHYHYNTISGSRLNRVTPYGKDRVEVEYWAGNTIKTSIVSILRDEDRADMREDEWEYEVEEWSETKNCPSIELPMPEDFLFSPDGDGPKDASYVFYGTWMSLREILARGRTGEYKLSRKLVDRLRKDREQESASEGSGLFTEATRQRSDLYTGIRSASARRSYLFLVLKVFMQQDCDGDGYPEEVIHTILVDTQTEFHLLRSDWMESLFPLRERPFASSIFIYLDSIPAAIGVPRWLRTIQSALDTNWNQRIDRNTIINNPFFFYDASSTLNPGVIRVRPGTGVPVGNAQGVHFPAFPQNTVAELQTEQALLGFAERMVPIGDNQMGNNSGGRPAVGHTALMLEESKEAFGKYIGRFGTAVQDVSRIAISLYAANMEPWKEFRVTADKPKLYRMDREALRRGFDVRVLATAILANKEIQRTNAVMRLQLLAPLPSMQTEAKQYQLIKDFLAAQDYKNAPLLLGPRPKDRTPMDPLQEFAMMVQGVEVDPQMQEDFEYHLQQHANQLATEPLAKIPKVRELLVEHMKATHGLMSVVQRQKMQQTLGIPPGQAQAAPFGQAGGSTPLGNSQRASQTFAMQGYGVGDQG